MSQKTINYETKINDLKKAMKEILTTPICVLRNYENPKNLSSTLEKIFTRNNIPEEKIKHYIEFLKANLEAEGKNFDLCTIIDLINGNNLSAFIIAFICNVFDIKYFYESLNIQKQIISELNQQFGYTPPKKNKYALFNFSNNKSNTNDLSSSEILFSSENEFDENQTIEQHIKQFKNDVAIRSVMRDLSKLLTLIKMLRNMRDKLSEVFSQQAIENVINFLEDILNNNINEINSIINMVEEFNDINNISSIIHFLHNFSRRYPEIMGAEPIPKSEINKPEIEH